jgi:hypothetical protein
MTLTEDEILEKLSDPMWRIASGVIYKIITKGDDDDDEGLVVDFIPNRAQRKLLKRIWYRNNILKARQLGFTTLVAILWLDTALFSKSPIQCGIIAQDKEAAEKIFRGKVQFAYNNLPDFLKAKFPLARANASELEFAHNGASIRVATSMRSGTIHRLHISEFGKISAKYPDKAVEVVTGSIPAVPKTGIIIIESTAEGQDGEYYKITQRSMKMDEAKTNLTQRDYRFHFFPWWEESGYELDPKHVLLTESDRKYFADVENKIGRTLSPEKKAWYVATREADYSGDPTKMWQEYPSYPAEAFQVSTDGCWYSEQMAKVRTSGRIIRGIPRVPVPINTFWDIGRGDMTSIWFHQYATMQHRFLNYYESSLEDLIHYTNYLQRMAVERGYTYGTHYIPHESDHKRIGETPDTNKSIKEMLEALLPGHTFVVVPRITNLQAGIEQTRMHLAQAWFDEDGCSQGIKRLENYRKRWNKTLGCWSDQEVSDDNAHGADAFRQWAQTVEAGINLAGNSGQARLKRTGSGMAR